MDYTIDTLSLVTNKNLALPYLTPSHPPTQRHFRLFTRIPALMFQLRKCHSTVCPVISGFQFTGQFQTNAVTLAFSYPHGIFVVILGLAKMRAHFTSQLCHY